MGTSAIADSRYTRTVYISTDISRIPQTADIVAGRINGPYQVPVTDWQLFPDSALITVDALGVSPESGDVLDLASGDATTGLVKDWIDAHDQARFYTPGVRCTVAQYGQLAAALEPGSWAPWVVYGVGRSKWDGVMVLENAQLATTAGAAVWTGTVTDPAWHPCPPATRDLRDAYDHANPHQARLRAGLPLQTSARSRARGNPK